MRKMITLLAATALVVSPFAFADDTTTGNPNDVLQTVSQPGSTNTDNNTVAGKTIADADASNSGTMDKSDASSASTAKPATTKHKHHKKCHNCKTKKHHKSKKKPKTATAPSNETTAAPGDNKAPAAQ